MSRVFQLSDEQYAKLAAYAAQRKQTPETLFETWVNEVTHNGETLPAFSTTERLSQEVKEGHDEEPLNHPLLQIAGMFAIGEPGWADKHDEYLAEVYAVGKLQ